jgi:hypothetical protein
MAGRGPGDPGAGAGTTTRRTCGRRTGTGTLRRTGTTTWASASPELNGRGGLRAGLNRSPSRSDVGQIVTNDRPLLVAPGEDSGRLTTSSRFWRINPPWSQNSGRLRDALHQPEEVSDACRRPVGDLADSAVRSLSHHMTDGRTYDIVHPEAVFVLKSRAIIGLRPDPETNIPDQSEQIVLLHIVRTSEIPVVGSERTPSRAT